MFHGNRGFRSGIGSRLVLSLIIAVVCFLSATAGETPEANSSPIRGVVVDADGKPVAGALVAFTGPWRQSEAPEAIETRTDATGHFKLSLAEPARLPGSYFGTIWAHKAGSGIARHELTAPKSRIELKLPERAETRIQVVSPDGAPVTGARVMHTGRRIAMTRDGHKVYGSAALPDPIAESTAVTTDSNGVAALTAMTSDEISGVCCVTPEWGWQEAHRPHETQRDAILRLRRVGRVRGQVVCKQPEAARAIKVHLRTASADAEDWNTAVRGSAVVTTDDQGRFEASVLAAGRLSASAAPRLDSPFFSKPPAGDQLSVGGEAVVTIELARAVRVRGVVRERGMGSPRANPHLMRNINDSAFVEFELDHEGRFEFFHPFGRTIQLLPSMYHGRPSWVFYAFAINSTEESLDLPPLDLLLARGRIVDEAGGPISGAKIDQAWIRHEFDGEIKERKVRYGSEAPLLSVDADGRFEVQVAASHAYRLLVTAEGMQPAQTDWIDFSRPEVNAFPDIVLHSSRILSGRVTDRQGRPIAGATVFQAANHVKRTEAVADPQGKFTLAGVNAGALFVFARHEGFGFHGQILKDNSEQVAIVLTRADETPAQPLKPLPSPLTSGEELALARRLMLEHLERALASDKDAFKRRALEVWAMLDPRDCLKRLEGVKFADPEQADAVRIAAAKALAAEHPDEAQQVLESIRDGAARAFAAIEALDAIPASARESKLQLLAVRVGFAEKIDNPIMRTFILARVVRREFELGRKEEAETLARRLVEQVKDVVCDPDECCGLTPQGAAAVALAPFDLEAALKHVPQRAEAAEESEAEEGRRYLIAAMASAVAASKPEGAERVLLMLDEPFRAQAVPSVCYRMAAADLPRARRLAASIEEPETRALAHAALAEALRATDRTVAAECLDESFRALARPAEDASADVVYRAQIAASLLLLVEEVAPERLSELLWLAISLNHSERDLSQGASHQFQNAAAIAAQVACYDQQAARLLLGVPEETLKTLGGNQGGYQLRTYAAIFTALAAIDPSKAVELLETLPNKPDDEGEVESPREAALRAMVQLLASQGESRRHMLKRLLGVADFAEDDF